MQRSERRIPASFVTPTCNRLLKSSGYNETTRAKTSNSDFVTSDSMNDSKKSAGGWNEEQTRMFQWLLGRGYDPELSKKLVMMAYDVECERPHRMGRVFRTAGQSVPVTWEGDVPIRNYVNPTFSRKVFIGGVPWDITESDLLSAFQAYGVCSVEWPNRSQQEDKALHRTRPIGYVYMIFSEEDSIKKLLKDCTQEYGSAGEYHFKLSARRAHLSTEIRQVQIIPWVTSDSFHVVDASAKIERNRTIFVGALHGMLTAQILYSILNDVYGDVVFVGLDNDKFKYPIGSGRVSFSSDSAFFQAVKDGYLEIRTTKFTKKIQIDPFMEYAKCSRCLSENGTYFCRNRSCFKHFCGNCWEVCHSALKFREDHKPVVRHPKRTTSFGSDNFTESPMRNYLDEECLGSQLPLLNYGYKKGHFVSIQTAKTLSWLTLAGVPLPAPRSSKKTSYGYWETKQRNSAPEKIKLSMKPSFCSQDSSDGTSCLSSVTSSNSTDEASEGLSDKYPDLPKSPE